MRRCGHEIWALEMGSEVKIWVESRDVNKILGSDTGFLTFPLPFRTLSDPLVFVVVLILLVKRTTPYQVGLKVVRQSIETYVIQVRN